MISPTGTLPQRDTDKTIASPVSGRAEVTVAITGLIEKVEHLALHVNRIVALADSANAILAKARRVRENADQFRAVSGSGDDPQAADRTEATNFPLSPHQDRWTRDVNASEIVDQLKSNRALVESGEASSRAKNAIAGRVLELHERLGGFIKPLR